MLCSYDDLCYIICTVLHGRYCVIQHSCCNTNETIIIYKLFLHTQKYFVVCRCLSVVLVILLHLQATWDIPVISSDCIQQKTEFVT